MYSIRSLIKKANKLLLLFKLEIMTTSSPLDIDRWIEGMSQFDKWSIIIKLLGSDSDLKLDVAKLFREEKSGNADKNAATTNVEETDSSKKRHSMPTATRSSTNSIQSKSNSTSFNFELLLRGDFAEKAFEAVTERMKQPFFAESLLQIEQILSIADVIENHKFETANKTLEEMLKN